MPRNAPVQKYAVCNSDEIRARHLPRPRHPALQPAFAHRRHGHRRLLHERDRGLQLHPRRVPGRARAALRSGGQGSLCRGLVRQEHPGFRRRFRSLPLVGAGAYICGEETALLDSLEGKQGKPRFKPPFPADFGLYGAPTTINNTQSYASVPTILRKGAGVVREAGRGRTPAARPSSRCRATSNKPGNYEVPMGIPFVDLLEIAGGVQGGRKLKAVIPGGSRCTCCRRDKIMAANMDYDSLKAAGSSVGFGRGHRHGRDHLHGEGARAPVALLQE